MTNSVKTWGIAAIGVAVAGSLLWSAFNVFLGTHNAGNPQATIATDDDGRFHITGRAVLDDDGGATIRFTDLTDHEQLIAARTTPVGAPMPNLTAQLSRQVDGEVVLLLADGIPDGRVDWHVSVEPADN